MNAKIISWPAAALLLVLAAPAQAGDAQTTAARTEQAVQWLHQTHWVLDAAPAVDERLNARLVQVAGAIATELQAGGPLDLPQHSASADDQLTRLRGAVIERDVDLETLRNYREAQFEIYRALRRLETDPRDALMSADAAIAILKSLNAVETIDQNTVTQLRERTARRSAGGE